MFPSTGYFSKVAHRVSSVVADGCLTLTLPVFLLAAVFPSALLQGFPHEISKAICILKPVIHSDNGRLVLLIASFRTQNKIVLLSTRTSDVAILSSLELALT